MNLEELIFFLMASTRWWFQQSWRLQHMDPCSMVIFGLQNIPFLSFQCLVLHEQKHNDLQHPIIIYDPKHVNISTFEHRTKKIM